MQSKKLQNVLASVTGGLGGRAPKIATPSPRQLISLYKVTPEQLSEVRLKDITLEPVGQVNEALSLGDLLGNRFSIANTGLPAG